MHSKLLNSLMILFGIILIIAYSQIYTKITDVKSDEARACEGLYTIGVMSLTMGITLMMFPEQTVANVFIMYMTILLGIVITSLSAIIVNKEPAGDAKNWAIFVMVIGLLFIVGSGYSIYDANGAPKITYGCGMY
jgi:hypothetical protein